MKISKIISYVVLAVGVLSGVLLYLMNGGFSELMTEAGATEARELPLAQSTALVSPLYNLALVVIGVLLIVTLVTIIGGLIKNPSSLVKTLIGAGAFLVVVGISFALSKGKEVITRDGVVITEGTTRWVEAGIIAFYIFAAVAVGAMLVAGIKKSISN